MTTSSDIRERIVIDSTVHFGKPCVAGTRIPVQDVLELVQEGIPFDKIVQAYYPDLDVEDVKACVSYATELVRSEEIHVTHARENKRVLITRDKDFGALVFLKRKSTTGVILLRMTPSTVTQHAYFQWTIGRVYFLTDGAWCTPVTLLDNNIVCQNFSSELGFPREHRDM